MDGTNFFSPPRVADVVDPKCRVHVVDVPYAGNANLAAQSGGFTMISIDKNHPTLKPDSPLDEVMTYVRHTLAGVPLSSIMLGDKNIPLFVKMSLPVAQSGALLDMLHNTGFDASRIFPGFQGCAEAIREACRIRRNR